MKICLAYNANSGIEENWIKAFEKEGIQYFKVDLEKNDWMEQIQSDSFDFMIVVPHGFLSYKKQMFDEKVYVIKFVLGIKIYPSYQELLIYENKRLLSYWLKANNIPHPETNVFYDFKSAIEFIDKCKFPIVAKSNIGAAGSGIHILKNYSAAKGILIQTFKGKGLPRRKGPNFNKKNVYRRIIAKLSDFNFLVKKLNQYRNIQSDRDKHNILFQEFIPHDHEWKNVRIGDSFFSHKKIVKNEKASGTGIKIFTKPPESLLNFVKEITDKHNLSSLSIDLFEKEEGKYLVNEVQTYFGQPYKYLMAIEDKPGRFIYVDGKWIFESGDFNTNHSCDLRLAHH